LKVFTKEVKIGFFTFFAITSLYLGYNFLRGKKLFSNYNTYYVMYNDVEGVVKSTSVFFKGLKVGQVEKIKLFKSDSSNKVLVELFINNDISLSKSTTAVIISQDLLGSKAISLNIPDLREVISSGDTLLGLKEDDLSTTVSNLLTPIRDRSEQVLVTLDKVLSSLEEVFNEQGTQNLSKGLVDLTATIHNFRTTTEKLDNIIGSESQRITQIMTNVEGITATFKKQDEAITRTFNNMSKISDTLVAANIGQTMKQINELSKELTLLTNQINKGEGTLGLMAKDSALYRNMNKSAFELQSLLNDFQKYPKRYVNFSLFGGGSAKANKQRQAKTSKVN